MLKWALIFLMVGSSAWGTIFEAAREGLPATFSAEQFQVNKQNLLLELSRFRSQFITASLDPGRGENCRRFSAATQNVLYQLRSTLRQISSNAPLEAIADGQFENRIRFTLLQVAGINLYLVLKNQGEGGGSSLDPSAHSTCEFKDRPAVLTNYERLLQRMNSFGLAAFGSPGLFTLDRASDRLLKIAHNVAFWRNVESNVFFGASLFLAPTITVRVPLLVGAALRAAAGTASTEILASAFVKRMIGGAVFAGQVAGSFWLNGKIQPEEDPRERNFGVSWDDNLNQVEALLDSPESYAQLSVAYLGEQKSLLAQINREYLRNHADELKATYGNAFDETYAVALEAIFLNNRPLASQISRLEQVLAETYGYQVRCERGSVQNLYYASVTDVDCLAGLRKFARLAYRNELPILNTSTKLALNVRLSNSAGEFDSSAEPMLATLDVHADPRIMRAQMIPIVNHPALRQRVVDNQRFANLANTFTLNTGITIALQPGIPFADRWLALTNLVGIAERNPGRFELDADEIRLQSNFTSLADHGIKLRLGIDVSAGAVETENFLRAELGSPAHGARVALFTRQYEAMQRQVATLKGMGYQANCSGAGELSLSACVQTLGEVHDLLARISPKFIHQADIGGIFVRGVDEMSEVSEVTRNQNMGIWVVREKAPSVDLAYYLRQHGWIHE